MPANAPHRSQTEEKRPRPVCFFFKPKFRQSRSLSGSLARKSHGRFGPWDFRALAIFLPIALFSFSLFAQSPQPSASPGTGQITFSESIVGFPSSANQKAAVTLAQSELTQAESEATIEFSVALKMRDFAALKERIAKNEIISPDEMAAKYLPAQADYARIVTWLTKQVFRSSQQANAA
jgi:hypothetical protein